MLLSLSSTASSTASIAARRLAHIRMSSSTAQNGLREVFIVGAARTPVGSFQGALKAATAVQLGVAAVKGVLAQAQVKPDQVEDLYFGQVLQAGAGQSPARQVVLGAGMPESTEATTINKVCASGMKAVMLASQNIQTGQRDLMVAGGMESMSNAPFYAPRTPATFGHFQALDAIVKDGLTDVYGDYPMGNCAEETAAKHQISREDQDNYCLDSYRKAAEAWKAGAFKAEIAPVTLKSRAGEVVVEEDEEYKKIKPEKVASLKPVFKKDGTVTAANASNLNDGASALVLASQEKVDELSLKPLAKVISFADAACAPIDFPIAPAKAVPLALKRAGLSMDQISKFEVNEAFSAVAIANQKILGIPTEKLNVSGGAVALGHALGSSGSRIIVTLVHLLKPGEYGVAGVCNGGGGASAIVIQRL
ncbi:RHTO0S04e06788g1_1 [Rhodotorula toruloides]|uniref:acetyl-CoA C-acetyltransferase n=2 Tax=Rhodotorula toruloides TaxID=5286 RepID=A0A061AW42_RHOTO|nr:acetyl-CoA C-acetyltransferase [Rhodotorula toruloides NP11]EMS21177.1 acetyl-CoA C-acetyltransferase [Rhodotorula toruloides NP11]KAJ8293831.1 Acetyl-CoA acetyltransferase [Rhodotorula toruloides]WNH36684.1 acetoacetyl-CoA thiolase [synthetic construct]CDR39589.1 RHTO0S04e06788g1_1 [Rhodotorula toruloides]